MKKTFIFLTVTILFLSFSCSTVNDKYFKMVLGEWQIMKLYYKDDDLKLDNYYVIGFEENKNSWLIKREKGLSNFVYYDCKFYKKLDTLKMNITNCKDNRFNGIYNVYIDTIQENEERYIIQLALDSKNTYIQTIRPKLKGH